MMRLRLTCMCRVFVFIDGKKKKLPARDSNSKRFNIARSANVLLATTATGGRLDKRQIIYPDGERSIRFMIERRDIIVDTMLYVWGTIHTLFLFLIGMQVVYSLCSRNMT